MPTPTPLLFVVRWALIEFVLIQREPGSLNFGADIALAGGSPFVKHFVGRPSSPPVHAGSFAVVQGNDSYGHAASLMSPYWTTACRLSSTLLPSLSGNAPTWFFTDHCMYCSLKSTSAAGMPALRNRFSTTAVAAQIEHT